MRESKYKSRPKVSVSLITYNHADYIAQAIESVLMQETDFNYELIVGEDASSDGTREIVKAYKEKYPEKIRLLLNTRENVIYVDGKPTGRWNLINNLSHACGQYIAWLEGDDYWTSPEKLQVQADFLDSHPDYAICFHTVERLYEDEGEREIPGQTLTEDTYTIEDLLEKNFITACSVMFRNGPFDDFPDWYDKVPMGDWPLHILNAQNGNIGYIDEVMATYRIHRGGIRSLKSMLYKLRANVRTLEIIRGELEPRYYPVIDRNIVRYHLKIARILLQREGPRAVLSYISDLLEDKRLNSALAKAGLLFLFNKMGIHR